MKHFIICTMMLIFSTNCFSQQTNPTGTETQDHYLQKSKKQKTTALILAGGGLVLEISGAIAYQKGPAGLVLFGAGLISQVASIPFFISSGINKRKSRKAALSFKFNKMPDCVGMPSVRSNPELSLKLSW